MHYKKILIFATLFAVFVFYGCKRKETLGNVKDFYYLPIRAEYIYGMYTGTSIEGGELRREIVRIEKKSWGYIYYEHWKEIPPEGFMQKYRLKVWDIYFKTFLNTTENLIYRTQTDSKWEEKRNPKFPVLIGPIWKGKIWEVVLPVTISHFIKNRNESLKFKNSKKKEVILRTQVEGLRKEKFGGKILSCLLLKIQLRGKEFGRRPFKVSEYCKGIGYFGDRDERGWSVKLKNITWKRTK